MNHATEQNQGQLLAPFVSWLESSDYAPLSIRAYSVGMRDSATWFEHTNDKPLSPELITSLDVRTYRQHLQVARRLKATTINSYLAGIRAFVRWAQRTNRIVTNPTEGVKDINVGPLAPRWLTRRDQAKLLQTAGERARLGAPRSIRDPSHSSAIWPCRNNAIVVLMLNTGLRLSETTALQLDDIEIKGHSGSVRVRAGKGRKARTVTLNKDARSAFSQWLDARQHVDGSDSCPYLFLSQKGGQLTSRAIAFVIAGLAKRAGVEDVSPHRLRHSFAKNLIDAGVGLERVAALLGHANIDTTRRYITPSQADLQEAVERVASEV